MQVLGAEDQCLRIRYQPSLQMPQETLARHHLDGKPGRLLLSDGHTAQSRQVIEATAEVRHPRDESGV